MVQHPTSRRRRSVSSDERRRCICSRAAGGLHRLLRPEIPVWTAEVELVEGTGSSAIRGPTPFMETYPSEVGSDRPFLDAIGEDGEVIISVDVDISTANRSETSFGPVEKQIDLEKAIAFLEVAT